MSRDKYGNARPKRKRFYVYLDTREVMSLSSEQGVVPASKRIGPFKTKAGAQFYVEHTEKYPDPGGEYPPLTVAECERAAKKQQAQQRGTKSAIGKELAKHFGVTVTDVPLIQPQEGDFQGAIAFKAEDDNS